MDYRLSFRLSNCSPVTVFTYHPLRREIITGHDDGSIKGWNSDSGKLVVSLNHHRGIVSDLLFWSVGRTLFSCGVDGLLVQWTPSFIVNKEIHLGYAIYSLCWYYHAEVLLIGLKDTFGAIRLSGSTTSLGHPYLCSTVQRIEQGHSDIVKCIVSSRNKVYTAGYDGKLCIFEQAHRLNDGSNLADAGNKKRSQTREDLLLNLVFMKRNAHDAGITCLELGRDATANWIFTGSFDRRVKIWTSDGKLMNSLQFIGTVTGIGFVPETHILWVSAAGTSTALHFEPKSGDNISGYLDRLSHSLICDGKQSDGLQSTLQHLKYIPETTDIIGIRSTKEVIVSRCSRSNCICIQSHSEPLRCIAYTRTIPMLIFTGSDGGELIKWEQFQLNPFMYSKDTLMYKEELRTHLETDSGGVNLAYFIHGSDCAYQELGYEDSEIAKAEVMKPDNREFMKTIFFEELDMLVASARDGKIFVWGFDEKAAKVLLEMSWANNRREEGDHYSSQQEQEETSEEDIITYNRVAGLIIRHIMNGHSGPVEALTMANGSKKTTAICLLSGGWDLSVCIWDVASGKLFARRKNCIPAEHINKDEDLLITDIAYSNTRDTFAISSTNRMVYLMNFSLVEREITLLTSIKGHTDEVTQICWYPCSNVWISGSEDGRICVWSPDGSECIKSVSTQGPITVLAFDESCDLIVTCARDSIRVYNEDLDLVQISKGHDGLINDLIVMSELKQYVSVGSDGTLRIWNAAVASTSKESESSQK